MATGPLLLVLAVLIGTGGCGAGSSSVESGQPQPHGEGGEKSIEGFGAEAGGPERVALLGAFHGYLEAIASGDGASACSRLAARVRHSLEQLVGGRVRRGGCAAILPRLLTPAAAAAGRQQAEGKVTRVRAKDGRAFVVFHAPGAKLYQLTLVREGGRWKAATATASVLVPSASTLGR